MIWRCVGIVHFAFVYLIYEYSQEYAQLKIDRKIGIFSLGQKNNLFIDKNRTWGEYRPVATEKKK